MLLLISILRVSYIAGNELYLSVRPQLLQESKSVESSPLLLLLLLRLLLLLLLLLPEATDPDCKHTQL
jgi:hypothetical protein